VRQFLAGCVLDLDLSTASFGELTVELRPREAEVLAYLAERSGHLVPRAELHREVWGLRDSVVTHAVSVCMRRLRTAIAPLPMTIRTVRGKGWILEATEDSRLVGPAGTRAAMSAAADRPGLVVVVGAPGIGKSHLARQLAGRSGWVDCSSATHAHGLVAAISRALSVAPEPREAVFAAIRQAGMLVLDGLSATLAGTVADLVAEAPESTLVVTCHAPLSLPGERVVRVPPLDRATSRELFASLAPHTAADPRLDELLGHLDGLPLAIELAAARARVMGVADLIERVERPDLLRDGRRQGRHRGLREAVEACIEGLPSEVRAAMTRVAVFTGAFDLQAAEASLPLDALIELVDAGLVVRDDDRYRVLRPIRTVALDLAGDGLREAQLDHARLLARRAREAIGPVDVPALHADVRTWFSNDRVELAAAESSAHVHDHPELALELGLARLHALRVVGPATLLDESFVRIKPRVAGGAPSQRMAFYSLYADRLWRQGDPVRGGQAWQTAREAATTSVEVGHLEVWYSGVCRETGRLKEGEALLQSAVKRLEPAARTGDAQAIFALGKATMARASQANRQDRVDDAAALYRQAADLHRSMGAHRHEGASVANLGQLLDQQGRRREAERAFREARELFELVGDRWMLARIESQLGGVALHVGELDAAAAYTDSALKRVRELRDRTQEGHLLLMQGEIAAAHGEFERMRERFTEALSILSGSHAPLLVAQCKARRGLCTWFSGDAAEGRAWLEDALVSMPDLGAAPLALTQTLLAALLADTGELERAQSLFAQAGQPELPFVRDASLAFLDLARAANAPDRRERSAALGEATRRLRACQFGEAGELSPEHRSFTVRVLATMLRTRLAAT
jgi:DNA-binding winged helix-turn-helix (wHTH) protein/tetratricopeptide (TPR) repeat protein